MAAKTKFRGSFTALVTPFKNGSLDESAFRSLVNWQIAEGTNGLVPVGTTGESPTLSHDEHNKVVEWCVDQANGRVPVQPERGIGIFGPELDAGDVAETDQIAVGAAANHQSPELLGRRERPLDPQCHILLRFQTQAVEQPFQTIPDNIVVPNPALDRQAATG